MSETSEIIAKVAKLLALSKSSNIHEATAAAGKASELMDKYRLSIAQIVSNETSLAEPVEQDMQAPIYETGRTVLWKTNLVYVLCHHYGVAYYFDFAKTAEMGRKYTQIRLVGTKSNVEIVRYFFAYLSAEIQRISDAENKGKGFSHVYIFSYCEGFVAGIEKQLAASRIVAKNEANVSSVALAIIDNAFDEASAVMNSKIKLKTIATNSQRKFNSSGYSQGQKAGETMHLGSALNAGKGNLLGN